MKIALTTAITMLVALSTAAAYTLLGMAPASAANLIDQDADWAGTMETFHYKCPGDDDGLDIVSYGVGHLMSDTNRYIILVDSIRPRRGMGKKNDRRKGVRLPVIRVDIETDTVTFNGRRCRPYKREGWFD
jgi:hypothetical protein